MAQQTSPQSSPRAASDHAVEYAYEHERLQLLLPVKWGSDFPGYMLPTDRKGWTDRAGDPVPFHPQTATESSNVEWLSEWEIDRSGGCCDEEGWTYAADFSLIEKGTSKCGVTDFVRRRKWRRTRKSGPLGKAKKVDVDPLTLDVEGRIQGFPRGPLDKGTCCWSESPGTNFSLRGATYISDKIKITSENSLMTLLHVDMFSSSSRVDRVCDKPDGYLAHIRAKGDRRFILCINFQAPPHHMTCYYAIPEDADWDQPTRSLWERFVMADSEFKNARWKVVPIVVDGPWMIKKSVGQKPALLGTKLHHTYVNGDDYLEMDCNIYSSKTASWLVELMKGYATAFVIDIGFCIQGNEPEELPERILGAVRFSKIDLKKARPTDWS